MPTDPITRRVRGGSRYGLSKALAAQVDTTPGPVWAGAGIWNAAATVQHVMAVIKSSTPQVRRLSSGSWATATDSTSGTAFSADTMADKRVVLFPSLTAGHMIMACAGWSKTWDYNVDTNVVSDHTSNAAISGMQWVEKLWIIVGPRSIKNLTDSLDYTLKTPGDATANDPLTACATWGGTRGVFWTKSTTTTIAGNPVLGNAFRTVSARHGCIDAKAYCEVPNGPMYFMSAQGLCEMATPEAGGIRVVSDERIGDRLINIDPASYHVSMAYDSRYRGVHIWIARLSALAGVEHWFYKLAESGCPAGFWLQTLHTDTEPLCVFSLSESAAGLSASAYTDLVLGGRNGYMYRPDPTVATDDGNALTSTIYLGPFYGYSPERVGKVLAIRTSLGTSSGTVTASIHVGDSAQEAFSASAFDSIDLVAGTNVTWRPNARAYSWFLKLTSTARWAWEHCVAERIDAGSAY